MTTATLTKTEALAIAHAARYVVGVSWDYLEADTLKGKLTEAIADDHDHRLEVLLALIDGVRYDLCGLDQQTLRQATVIETVDSLMEEGGLIEVDGVECYADLS